MEFVCDKCRKIKQAKDLGYDGPLDREVFNFDEKTPWQTLCLDCEKKHKRGKDRGGKDG